MAYVRPLVQVYQEYESLSGTAQSTTLNPCIIGPCYQVLDESSNLEEKLLETYFGQLTATGLAEAEVPQLKAGALLVEDSVKVRFTQAFADIGGAEIAIETITNNVLTFLVGTYPVGIIAGDYVTVKDGTAVAADKFLVTAVDADSYEVSLNRVVSGTLTAPKATWLQEIDEFTLDATDDAITISVTESTVTIGAVSQSVGGSDKNVYAASINCGYKALRRDVDTVQTADSLDVIVAKLGSAVPENILAFGAMIALANTSYTVYFIGVDSDDTAGYTKAKDLLENTEDIYSIVPLTQDPGILSIFKVHAEASSQPAVGKWRVAFGNSPLPSTITVSEGMCYLQEDGSEALKVIYSENAAFLTEGVNAGDALIVTKSDDTTVELVVSSVASEDRLILDVAATGLTADSPEYAFAITREVDKTTQAENIRDTSIAYGSSRFVHVWPDVCIIDDEELPGYYLCCAIAGMVSGLPSQQGLTRISVAGISGVVHSGDYFNSTQLDTIADGGTFILMQLSASAPPYIRHQLTTDSSTYEFSELSFVKNFDFTSYICKDVLDKFLGKYNVTQSTLGALETGLRAVLESLKLSSMPKIGSPVIGYSIESVAQSEAEKSRVEMYALVEFPYALNTIGLHIVSSDL